MARIRGLFLDMDGTLADSMGALEGVYFEFMADLGLEAGHEEFQELAGYTLPRIMALLRERRGVKLPAEALLGRFLELLEESYPRQVRPSPGGRRLLETAARRGIFTAVVTSAPRETALGFLRRHDLERLTAAVVGAEDVRRGKPHAEPYRLALELGGLPPESGLAVEDSLNGARSALAAGLATYVITLGGGPHPRVPGARGFIRRLDELLPLLEGGA